MGAGDFLNKATGSAEKSAQNGLKSASDAITKGEGLAQQEAAAAEQKAKAAEAAAQKEIQQAEHKVQQAEQKLANAEKQAQQALANAEKQAEQQLANAEKKAQQLEAEAQKELQKAQQELQQAQKALADAEAKALKEAQALEKAAEQTAQKAMQQAAAAEKALQQDAAAAQQKALDTLSSLKNDVVQAAAQAVRMAAIGARAAAILAQAPLQPLAQAAAVIYNKVQQAYSSDPVDSTETPCANKSVYSVADAIKLDQQLIQQAQNAGLGDNPSVKALGKLANDQQLALMADDVYSATPSIDIPGFKRATPQDLDKLGLSPADFLSKSPDFQAALYIAKNPPASLVTAFRGTVPTSMPNWLNNAQNALGIESEGYNKAIALAEKVQRAAQLQGAAFQVAGHSLGGGLAQAAASSLAAGGKAVSGAIFNAAGYNPSSTPGFPSQSTVKSLTNYTVNGDPLTTAQSTILGLKSAAAQQVSIPGPANAGLVGLHSMKSVEAGMANTNKQAASAVSNLLGGK